MNQAPKIENPKIPPRPGYQENREVEKDYIINPTVQDILDYAEILRDSGSYGFRWAIVVDTTGINFLFYGMQRICIGVSSRLHSSP